MLKKYFHDNSNFAINSANMLMSFFLGFLIFSISWTRFGPNLAIFRENKLIFGILDIGRSKCIQYRREIMQNQQKYCRFRKMSENDFSTSRGRTGALPAAPLWGEKKSEFLEIILISLISSQNPKIFSKISDRGHHRPRGSKNKSFRKPPS